MKTVRCDDCKKELYGNQLFRVDGACDLGKNADVSGVSFVVPIYTGASLLNFKEIDLCLKCTMKRGLRENGRKP